MDLGKIIQELSADQAKLEAAIALLEDLHRNPVPIPALPKSKRRGRKAMPPEERDEVSARMKRYWAARRAERQKAKLA